MFLESYHYFQQQQFQLNWEGMLPKNEYKIGDMVFAKCQNYPFWPGKVITIFPGNFSFKILFYGEKSQATIDQGYILPFAEQTMRKILNEGNNKYNKDLKNSMNIAFKRYNKRKKGLESSSEEDDFIAQSDTHKKHQSLHQLFKIKKITEIKLNEDPYSELANLLNILGTEAASFTTSNTPKLNVENQLRLKQLLQPGFKLELKVVIESKLIQKFIILIKQIDLWGLKKPYVQLGKLVKQRYEQYKKFILSQQFAMIPLKQAKRQIIQQKVLLNKVVL